MKLPPDGLDVHYFPTVKALRPTLIVTADLIVAHVDDRTVTFTYSKTDKFPTSCTCGQRYCEHSVKAGLQATEILWGWHQKIRREAV
jgi:hypothetical protein